MAILGGDGSIILTTKIDQSGLNKGMASLKGAITKLGAAIGVAFGVRALVQFGKQAVQLASDLQEVQNVVDVAFGDMAYRMEQFADTAIETFGISELSAKQTGSSFMAMAKGMQFADNVAADMALTLTGLSADMASFYNIRQEEAKTALSAVYTGETETLKRYGILITEVNLQEFARQQGITKSINAMTQQEKAMLRYQYILQATQLSQGDFVRTQDSWANQTRILAERWKEMRTVFGEAFMTIGVLALPVINNIIVGLTKVAQAAQVAAQWIYKAFTGKELKTTQSQGTALSGVGVGANEAADGMEALGDATEKAGKQAKKSLAAFDDLNIISSGAGGESGNSSEIVTGGIGGMSSDTSLAVATTAGTGEQTNWLTQRFTEFAEAFGGLSELDLSNLSSGLMGLKKPLSELANMVWSDILWGIDTVIVPLTNFTIKEALPDFLKKLSDRLLGVKKVLEKIQSVARNFVEKFIIPLAVQVKNELTPAWEHLNNAMKDIENRLANSELWQDLKVVLELIYNVLIVVIGAFANLFGWINKIATTQAWNDLKTVISDVEDSIGFLAAIIRGDFVDAWKHLKELLIDNRIEDAKQDFELLGDILKDVISNLKDVAKIFKEKIDEIISNWKTKIASWWEDDVKPWFTKEKWEELFFKIGESLATAIVGANGFVQKWNTNISNWWKDDVSPWFTVKKWKELFINITEGTKRFFTGDDGFVKTWGRKMNDWWNNEVAPWFTVEKWKELGANIKEGLVEGFEGVVNGIRKITNKILDGFQGLVNGAIDMINSLIAGWNTVANKTGLSTIPLVQHTDLSKYKLPMLAQGTVVPPNKPFAAILGDNTKEHEIVSPISTLKQALTEAMFEMGATSHPTKEEHYYLNETELMSVIYRLVKGGERLQGNSLVSTGGVY